MDSSQLHVVLGASGAVGRAVVAELLEAKLKVVAVERSRDVPGVEVVFADLCDRLATVAALARADYVYLCVGLPYATKVWRSQWPVIVDNVLVACQASGAKLIFFDNVDMYGPSPLPVPFDERTSQHPVGAKALVRRQIAGTILQAHDEGRVSALIARSANFFGPGMVKSPLYTGFLANMSRGKRPVFVGAIDVPHTYAYTRDNARAMVRLALDETAYGEVWHLPVSGPITALELAELANRALGSRLRLRGIPRSLRTALARFVPIFGEVEEMMHHFDNPYVMSWDKFHMAYPDFTTTSLDEAISVTMASLSSAPSVEGPGPLTKSTG